jgi:D-alanyl-lipoteichoic acid acyltransferase DltB (MBOAT superfamily)
MNFSELRFWLLLGGGLAVALTLRWPIRLGWPRYLVQYDRWALLLLGWMLLLAVSWLTFVIFLAVACLTYGALVWLTSGRVRHPRRYLFLLVPLQLAPLIYYKYSDFLANRVLGLDYDMLRGIMIPAGISFYTFQAIAFAADTLALRIDRPRFGDYLNFIGFFPQVVAGPIERRKDLQPQMERFRFAWEPQQLNEGAGWIVVGLFFKLALADNLAGYFDPSQTGNAYRIWLANLLFGMRIYYDFAGYSMIAVGLGRCLGIRLTLNFLSPYCALSMVEFWRRWHITLSQWFRDYVYIPLGGGRTQWWFFNVMVVFVVSGIWHGAGWNFVFWGGLHGLFLLLNRLAGRRVRIPRTLSWGLTMVGVFFAWLCFYEQRSAVLFQKIATLLTPQAYSPGALKEFCQLHASGDGITLAGFLVLGGISVLAEWRSLAVHNEPYTLFRGAWASCLLVVLTLALAPGKQNAFIYFAF